MMQMGDRPTLYQLRAALRVARLVDETGNWAEDARSSYRQAATEGEHPALSLDSGEELLRNLGLIELIDDHLVPVSALHILAGMDDDTALAALALRFETREVADGVDLRADIGAAGEEAVTRACQDELRGLSRFDLADRVQRVSLVSDALGYDVVAPTLVGTVRALEVKTTTSPLTDHFRFFISRNEFDVGRRRDATWALVACRARADLMRDEVVDIVGWCRVGALRPYLPDDGAGRWTEALVRLPIAALMDGLPPPV